MASMVAGTKYRGDFEERFKNLLEALYRDRSTILFIDEIHLIAGAGAAEGAIDAASILKPMLARGEIQLIGATTPEEYRKTIQKDSALERRFGRVMVEEPTPAAAETILAGLMPRYERYHGVSIPPEAIHAAVELSVRYLPGRYLPDKAIDLLDEAAAARRIADASGNRRALTPADIARVVSKASGVPAERVGEAERERLANLEQRLAAEVIGQPQAVAAVASAIRRSRTGLRESGRPIGAMLFLGPTGVGKTQLARTLAKCWFGSEKALLRFDMSEYMERHTVARLLGAPPGYVGHAEGGPLPEAVRRESERLAPVRERADFVINTTGLTLAMLQKRICEYFADGGTRRDILVNVVSFGFNYGIPIDADLVFDVRFLPNPYYIPALKTQTGLNEPVRNFIFQYQQTKDFLEKTEDLLTFLLPNYVDEGKTGSTARRASPKSCMTLSPDAATVPISATGT